MHLELIFALFSFSHHLIAPYYNSPNLLHMNSGIGANCLEFNAITISVYWRLLHHSRYMKHEDLVGACSPLGLICDIFCACMHASQYEQNFNAIIIMSAFYHTCYSNYSTINCYFHDYHCPQAYQLQSLYMFLATIILWLITLLQTQ